MSYSIVPAIEGHFLELHQVIDTVAREQKYLAFTQAPPWEQSQAFYRSLLDNSFPQFVALHDGTVVGWCDVAPLMGESRAHIGTLGMGLLPAIRHKGLGTRLIRATIEKCWSRGLTRIELTVRADNDNARALYERFGFEPEGIRRRGSLIAGVYHDVHAMALLR